MNQINFQSENLVVDWISFNIKGLTDPEPIAIYLSESFGFNSIITKGSKRKSESLVSKFENQYQVFFKQYDYNPELKSFWARTKVNFSGDNATYFYSLIKEKRVDWNIFDLRYTTLSRFDLYYFRKPKPTDQKDHVELFMDQCCQKILAKSKRRHASWSRNSKGLILKVGSRQSSNYFRVYRRPNGKDIRFELELTKSVVKNFEFYLFSNQFEKLEELLSIYFYKQALTTFVMDSCYTDWLRESFRKIRSTQTYENCLITTYLRNIPLETLEKQRFLYQLLQLLSYIRTLESSVNWISNENYRMISFRVSEFLEFLGKKKTNYYQIRKVVDFLKSLQRLPPVLEDFSTESFRSILIFPYLEVRKEKSWNVELAIAEKVYFYRYPFYFPQEFLTYDNAYDLRAKIFFLLSFSTTSLNKEFQIQEVLDQVGISRQKITRLRKSVVTIFENAQDLKLIEPRFTYKKGYILAF